MTELNKQNIKAKDLWKLCRIGREYHFSAAHFLTGVPANHQCARLHGHNYKVEVEVRGLTHPKTGFVVDFHEIDRIVKPVIEELDHRSLNDFPGLENPTAEMLAQWIMSRVDPSILYRVRVWETDKAWAEVVNAEGLYPSEHRE